MGRSFRAGHQAELTDSVTDSFKPPPPAPLHRSKPDASVARSYPSLVRSPLLQRTRDSQSFAGEQALALLALLLSGSLVNACVSSLRPMFCFGR
jgi:hypothetical protein